VLDVPPELVLAAFETNTLGALKVTQALAPLLVAAGGGNVVNVSSGMGGLTEMGGGSTPYRLSKAALNALTRVLHAELSGRGVRVNSVCPGWVRTDMGGASAPRGVDQGASGIVWAATLEEGGPSGGFFRDGRPIAW
jgi:NAD(P)-dependent dehydrogenase (short-subunit alcohol dehydrogenase family)